MDPNAAYTEMIESFQNGDMDTAINCAISLNEWITKGGFLPTNVYPYDFHKTLLNVLTLAR